MFFWSSLSKYLRKILIPTILVEFYISFFVWIIYYRSYRYSFLWSERPPAPGLADAVTYLEESGVVTE
jgi:hypothetical protein